MRLRTGGDSTAIRTGAVMAVQTTPAASYYRMSTDRQEASIPAQLAPPGTFPFACRATQFPLNGGAGTSAINVYGRAPAAEVACAGEPIPLRRNKSTRLLSGS